MTEPRYYEECGAPVPPGRRFFWSSACSRRTKGQLRPGEAGPWQARSDDDR